MPLSTQGFLSPGVASEMTQCTHLFTIRAVVQLSLSSSVCGHGFKFLTHFLANLFFLSLLRQIFMPLGQTFLKSISF